MADREGNESPECSKRRIQEEHNIDVVFCNDNIMEQILSNIYRFQERLPMEMVSRRFRQISKKAGWIVPNEYYSTLKLTMPEGSSRCLASFGSCHKYQQVLTVELARQMAIDDPAKFIQPPELTFILQKFLTVKKNIRNVVFGGKAKDYYSGFEGSYQSILLTKDLFEYLENFPNLASLKLADLGVDENAISYVSSPSCQFKHRIESLSIICMRQDFWLRHLITPSLRNLTIRRLNMEKAELFLGQIIDLNLHLDSVNFEIASCENFHDAKDIMTKFSNRCKKMDLTFSSMDYKPGTNLLLLARSIDSWTNIRSLILTSRSDSIRDAVDISVIFEKLAHLRHLEKLTITENIKTSLLHFLRKGIQDLPNLKYLNFSDRSKFKETGILQEFLANLPKSLEEVKFDGLMWESEAVEAFCKRLSENLKRITITRPRHTSATRLFIKLVTSFPNLDTLNFRSAVPWQLIAHVLDHKKLNDVTMSTSNRCSTRVEVVLQDNFQSFTKRSYDDSDELEFSGRKESKLTLAHLPIGRNPHEKRQKMQW
ncbi:unnamed protein product [Caenorhabditis angaria]|uniref:Uncharacterized protein n=1 Tax=Caenorhabditis angaria TaxID=860376 RepID=A0A9P1IWU8_9PELO|nr:unnamed protein product [Caenorhabditis angaria]